MLLQFHAQKTFISFSLKEMEKEGHRSCFDSFFKSILMALLWLPCMQNYPIMYIFIHLANTKFTEFIISFASKMPEKIWLKPIEITKWRSIMWQIVAIFIHFIHVFIVDFTCCKFIWTQHNITNQSPLWDISKSKEN